GRRRRAWAAAERSTRGPQPAEASRCPRAAAARRSGRRVEVERGGTGQLPRATARRRRSDGERDALRRLVTDGVEQGLVDLAVVDGHVALEADPDDLATLDAELLCDLLGGQVVRHARPPIDVAEGWARKRKSPPRQDAPWAPGTALSIR